MIRNHLTIAWRHRKKHAFYSIINITGLAVGVASCIVIRAAVVVCRELVAGNLHLQSRDWNQCIFSGRRSRVDRSVAYDNPSIDQGRFSQPGYVIAKRVRVRLNSKSGA